LIFARDCTEFLLELKLYNPIGICAPRDAIVQQVILKLIDGGRFLAVDVWRAADQRRDLLLCFCAGEGRRRHSHHKPAEPCWGETLTAP
jgi:hypothetical protein